MSPFKALETTIKKQDDEIERLKNTQKVRTPIKAKGCPRGFLNFNIKTLMNTHSTEYSKDPSFAHQGEGHFLNIVALY